MKKTAWILAMMDAALARATAAQGTTSCGLRVRRRF